jgi:hypothetical protein
MKMRVSRFVLLLAALFLAGRVSAAAPDHTALVTQYEGTKTCIACHEKSAKEVAESLHYQQLAEPRFLKDWPKDQPAGMMVSY